MWWLLRIVVFVALLSVLVFVATKNTVPVDVWLLGYQVEQTPLFLVMFGGALFGLLAGLVLAGFREMQWRMLNSRQMKQRTHLEKEVHELRKAPLKGLDDSPVVGDSAHDVTGRSR